jgi:hypothetical protein
VIVERPNLERRIAAVLLGGCGSGRTSLLLRLAHALGSDRAQYLDLSAAATTPERCLAAIAAVSRLQPATPVPQGSGTRDAFTGLLDFFDGAAAATPGATFLLDGFHEVRTVETSSAGWRPARAASCWRRASRPASTGSCATHRPGSK